MKKFIIIVIILIGLGAGAYYYINQVLLPVQLKGIVINKVREQLGRELSFSHIQFDFLHGLIVDDLTVYEKDSLTIPFVKIKQAQIGLDLAAIIKDKKIAIPAINLRSPAIHFLRSKTGEWNFSDLLQQKTNGPQGSPPLLLGNINIDKGQLELIDQLSDPGTTSVFHDIGMNIKLSLTKGIEFNLHVNPTENDALIQGKGYYQPLEKEINVEAQLKNIDLKKYLTLLPFALPLQLDEGFVTKANVVITRNENSLGVRGALDAQTKIGGNLPQPFYFDGHITADRLVFQLTPDRIDLDGSFSVDAKEARFADDKKAHGMIILNDLTLTRLAQDLNIKLANGNLKNITVKLGEDKTLTGDYTLQQTYFSSNNARIVANSVLSAQNATLQLANGNTLKGNFFLKDLALAQENGKWQAAAVLEGVPVELTVADRFSVLGKLETNRVELTQQDNKINIQASAKFTGAAGNSGDRTQFKGNVEIKNISATSDGPKWHILGHATSSDVLVDIDADKNFSGDPQIDFDVAIDPEDPTPLIYTGNTTFTNASLKGLAQAPEITAIKGKIEFTNDQLKTTDLTLNALGSQLRLSGRLQNFTAPLLDITASADTVDITTLKPFFAEQLEEYQLDPRGTVKASIAFKGSLAAPQKADITAVVDVLEGSLGGKKLPSPVENISGKIKYGKDSLEWEKLQLTYLKEDYTATGKLSNFQEPYINTQIKSSDGDLAAGVKIIKDRIHIDSLKGQYRKIPFEGQGNVYLKKDQSPDVDMRVQSHATLEDFAQAIPQVAEQIEKMNAKGLVALNLLFRGNVQDWQKGIIDLAAQSDKINLYNHTLNNIDLKYGQGLDSANGFRLKAACYGGDLKASGDFTLAKSEMPISLTSTLDNLDLAQLSKALKLKGQDLSGLLSAKLDLDGPLTEQRQLKGKGVIDITDGNIWQFNLLQGLWKALLIPEFENIIFTEGHLTFDIANRRISTQDLNLKGNVADLTASGWVDFDQNIYFMVNPQIKETSILSSASDLKKGPSALLAGAENYVNIKVAGTLTKPTYKVNTSPSKILKRTTGTLLEGVQGVLEDILQ